MSNLLRTASSARAPFLWVTQRPSDGTIDGGRALHVTTLSGKPGTLDPKRLPDLRAAASSFLEGAEDGVIVVDCLDFLVLHNGAERVQRALADLHDEVTVRGGTLIVLVDDQRTNPRLVAWLQRELDPLPEGADAVPVRESLAA